MCAKKTLDTRHVDMIHDVQLDFFGKRLATCSSDRTIKVFDVAGDAQTLTAELKSHEGAVWQVQWAHPKFKSLLASCGYDRKVLIWEETSKNVWRVAFEYKEHELSVNSISWAPHEYGLMLACGSSDGTISILSRKGMDNKSWSHIRFPAHKVGVTSVSWAPAAVPGSLLAEKTVGASSKRLVSGGCDNSGRVWRFSELKSQWVIDGVLEGHEDWVRDVAWAPNIGLPMDMIASCSQDKSVFIWYPDGKSKKEWRPKKLNTFSHVVWRISWSLTGNILAVSTGDNKVSLWKEGVDGEWTQVSSVDETGASK